jgi:hypothetical protein
MLLQALADGRHVVNGILSTKCSICDVTADVGHPHIMRVWLSDVDRLCVIARVCRRCCAAGEDARDSIGETVMTVPL